MKTDPLKAAIAYLMRREYSRAELMRCLLKKGYEKKTIHEALLRCEEKGYLSDERFAAQYCRARLSKGDGPLKIMQGLKAHGVTTEALQAVVQAEQIDWVAQATHVFQKQQWRFENQPDHQKARRFLLSRGFSIDIIQVVLG